MESGIPTTDQVRAAAPAELAVVLAELDIDLVGDLLDDDLEALVVATQKVASWCHAVQAVAVDRFAEVTSDRLDAHVLDLAADRGLPASRVVGVPDAGAVAASSLAPLLNIAPRTMRTRLNRARLLVELSTTLDHALAGSLEPWRVDGVVTAARDVAPDRLVEFEARLYAADVSRLPKPRLVERARRAAEKADREGVERAHAAAPRRRALRWAVSDTPGLMRWTLDLPDETSRRLAAAVDALAGEYLTAAAARPVGAPRLTVDAARLDALVDLAMANADVRTVVELVVPAAVGTDGSLVRRMAPEDVAHDALGSRTNARAGGRTAARTDQVLVDLVTGSVTAATLVCGDLERHLGLRVGRHLETAGNPFLTRDPACETVGHPPDPGRGPGPPGRGGATGVADGVDDLVWFVDGMVEAPGTTGLLPAQVVAILDDPDTLLRLGGGPPGSADGDFARRRSYRPGAALAARVRARDRHCRFPGCSVPAARCDLDHVDAYPFGRTEEANLHCLCRTHHGFKHHAGWLLAMTPDGTCTWTAPTGRTHTTSPGGLHDTAA